MASGKFNIFMKAKHAEVKAQMAGRGNVSISAELGKIWREMSVEEKSQYSDPPSNGNTPITGSVPKKTGRTRTPQKGRGGRTLTLPPPMRSEKLVEEFVDLTKII